MEPLRKWFVHQKSPSCCLNIGLVKSPFALLLLPLLLQELVLGLLLGLSRNIPSAHETMRRGEWAKKDFNGRTLNGKIIGIVGFGSVGRAVRVWDDFVVVGPQAVFQPR